jgi:hypothetical protein
VRKLLLSWTMLAALGVHAEAANIKNTAILGQSGGWLKAISIEGEIVAGDEIKFSNALAARMADQWTASTPIYVMLNSPGGLIAPALEIGHAIHAKALATFATVRCVSACGLIWLAGQTRFADVSVGFHSAENTTTNRIGNGANALVGVYLADLGLPVVNTDPSRMFYLTPRDASKYNLAVTWLGNPWMPVENPEVNNPTVNPRPSTCLSLGQVQRQADQIFPWASQERQRTAWVLRNYRPNC